MTGKIIGYVDGAGNPVDVGAPGPAVGASSHNLEHGAVPGRVTSLIVDNVRTEPTMSSSSSDRLTSGEGGDTPTPTGRRRGVSPGGGWREAPYNVVQSATISEPKPWGMSRREHGRRLLEQLRAALEVAR